MEAVAFGRPAAAEIAAEARRCGAERVFLMVSGTRNRTTDEVEKVRRALGNRCAGLFDRMPPYHTGLSLGARSMIEVGQVIHRHIRDGLSTGPQSCATQWIQ